MNAASGPAGQPVVCLSSLPWHAAVVTSRHHLARILAEDRPVLFVDPPANLLRERGGARGGPLAHEGGNLYRLTPAAHLPVGSPARMRITGPANERRYARAVVDAVRALGWQHPALWTCCPVAFATAVPRRLEPSVHLVHMTDTLWHHPWYHRGYERALVRLLARTDRVAASTPAMAAHFARFGMPATHLPHGIDPEHFAGAATGRLAQPAALRDRARPRIGFIGNVEQRLDLDAVLELARSPGSVTLIGPVDLPPEAVQRLRAAGVHLEGPVAYAQLPRWLAGFDVALLPYRATPLVAESRPLKLLEYLAAGLPVVATDIPAARALTPGVRVVEPGRGWRETVASVWAEQQRPGAADRRRARADQARPHTWRRRAEELAALLEPPATP